MLHVQPKVLYTTMRYDENKYWDKVHINMCIQFEDVPNMKLVVMTFQDFIPFTLYLIN